MTQRTAEAEADSIEAATDEALTQLGADRADVAVEVLSEPSKGLFGLGGRKARVRVTVAAAPVASAEPAYAAVEPERSDVPLDDDTVEKARQLLEELVTLAGFSGRVSGHNDGDHATLDILDETSGLIIGRKGQTLDALEYLVTRMVGRDDGRSVHITVDAQGYRARRQESLEEMARRLGDEARRRRRPVKVEDLSPRERRIIHMVLRQERGLSTHSTGDGHLRTLVIVPDGAGRRPRQED